MATARSVCTGRKQQLTLVGVDWLVKHVKAGYPKAQIARDPAEWGADVGMVLGKGQIARDIYISHKRLYLP